MQAIHQPLVHGTAVHHALYMEHFTPSTIYPYPQPAWVRQYGQDVNNGDQSPQSQQKNGAPNTHNISTVNGGSKSSALTIQGNLIVAGGSDLRVFEVRREPIGLRGSDGEDDTKDLQQAESAMGDVEMEDEDGFRQLGGAGKAEVRPRFNTSVARRMRQLFS